MTGVEPYQSFNAGSSWRALGIFWLLLAVTWLLVPFFRPRRGFGWWLLAGVIGCTGPFLTISGIGLIGRIALSESALVDYGWFPAPGPFCPCFRSSQ